MATNLLEQKTTETMSKIDQGQFPRGSLARTKPLPRHHVSHNGNRIHLNPPAADAIAL